MRTTAATRQPPADLTSKPLALTWLVHCREHKLLTPSEWALAAILVTMGQGQNITMSIVGMADITGMTRVTVRKCRDSLISKGLLVLDHPGKNQKNVYRLTLPRWSNDDHQGGQSSTTRWSNGDHNIKRRWRTTRTATSTCAPRR